MSYESLSHSKYSCTYHVVFVPKCRRKALYGKIRNFGTDQIYGAELDSWRTSLNPECRKNPGTDNAEIELLVDCAAGRIAQLC